MVRVQHFLVRRGVVVDDLRVDADGGHRHEHDEGCDDDHVGHSQRFDLCSSCHQKYLKNPLGRDATLLLGFSQN